MSEEKYLEMMKSNEPYISHFMKAPRDLKKNALKILKEIESLGYDDGEKKKELYKQLFGTYA